MECLIHSENERYAPRVWNLIRNNDPSLTHLVLKLHSTPTPSFYQNLAKVLQDNSNITHLKIEGENYIKCRPNVRLTIGGANNIKYIPNGIFQPIFESSKFIKTLTIFFPGDMGNEKHAKVDDVFDSLIKSKNNKITKLKIHVEDHIVEPLTKFLSTNIMENQMLKLILQQKIGAEAASKISNELFPTNSIKELYLYGDYGCVSAQTFIPLLKAIGNNRSLESLRINSCCCFDREDFNFELIIALENILSNSKALKKLDLIFDIIDLQDLKTIVLAIQKSPSLESFQFHTDLDILFLNTEHIKDEIKRCFAKVSNKLLLTKSHNFLEIEAYGYKKVRPKCLEKGKH